MDFCGPKHTSGYCSFQNYNVNDLRVFTLGNNQCTIIETSLFFFVRDLVNWIDKEGKTPLILTCMNSEGYDVAKTLLELGANVNTYRPGT